MATISEPALIPAWSAGEPEVEGGEERLSVFQDFFDKLDLEDLQEF